MAITVGDIFRVAFKQEYGAQDDVINVMHFTCTAVPVVGGDALLVQDVGEFAEQAWGNINSFQPNGLNPVDIEVYNVTDDAPAGVGGWGVYAGGTGVGEALPLADCVLCILPTGVKRTQGRIYLSPFMEGGQNDGLWVPSLVTAVEDFLDNLTAHFVGSNGYEFDYGVFRRSAGEMAAPTTYRVQPRTAYQLRRKPGRGS